MAGNVEAVVERLLPILPLLVSHSLTLRMNMLSLIISLHVDLHGRSLRPGILVSDDLCNAATVCMNISLLLATCCLHGYLHTSSLI